MGINHQQETWILIPILILLNQTETRCVPINHKPKMNKCLSHLPLQSNNNNKFLFTVSKKKEGKGRRCPPFSFKNFKDFHYFHVLSGCRFKRNKSFHSLIFFVIKWGGQGEGSREGFGWFTRSDPLDYYNVKSGRRMMEDETDPET